MVCKKCGNELTDGINICPYCGEGSNQKETKTPEINSFMNDLNNLKIDIDNEKEDIEKDKLNATLKDIQEFTQDLSKLKFEIEEAEKKETLESDNLTITQENITEVTQDLSNLKFELDELEREEILINDKENDTNQINDELDNIKTKIEDSKEEPSFVLDEVKIEPHIIEQETNTLIEENVFEIPAIPTIPVESLEISNDLDEVNDEKNNEETPSLDISSDLKIELEKLPEEKVSAETFEEQTKDDSEQNVDSDSIKIIPDIDLQVLPDSEDLSNNTTNESDNSEQNNLNDLINDLKGIKVENLNVDDSLQNKNIENLQKTKEEEEKRLNIYDLVNELKNVNVEGINSVPKAENIPVIPAVPAIEDEPELDKKFENDYLFKVATEDTDNNVEDKEPLKEDIQVDSTLLEENQTDLNNNDLEESVNNINEIELAEESIEEEGEIDIPEMTLPPFPEVPEIPEISNDLPSIEESDKIEEEPKQEVFINDNLVETKEEMPEETSVTDKELPKKDRTFMIIFIIVAIIGIALAIYLGYLLNQ